ncbi:RNA polymerase subunit sigma-70, partial [[Ruminococcus] gnavus]|nr:RNA polymerase subunit sigma-70 [Mediterraneibacter gnavus]
MKKFQKIFGVFEKRRIAPRKGGKHHQLSNEKGGENVEPNSREFYKQCAFQK